MGEISKLLQRELNNKELLLLRDKCGSIADNGREAQLNLWRFNETTANLRASSISNELAQLQS